MMAIMGSMFRYANRTRIFQNADVTGLQLSPELASSQSGIKFRYAEYGEGLEWGDARSGSASRERLRMKRPARAMSFRWCRVPSIFYAASKATKRDWVISRSPAAAACHARPSRA